MLNKKDFLKYASKLAFPIMIQNLIGTLVNIADTVMLGYVSQTAMSASSLANQFTFILFCLYYGMATGASVLCAQYWGKGDKKTVERILGLAERISLIVSFVFFVISFSMPATIMKIFILKGNFIFLYVYGILSGFYERPSKHRKNNAAFCHVHCFALCQCYL